MKSTSSNQVSELEPSHRKTVPNGAGLEKLYGILTKEFKELGGGEAFLKEERNWGPDAWQRYELEQKARKEHSK